MRLISLGYALFFLLCFTQEAFSFQCHTKDALGTLRIVDCGPNIPCCENGCCRIMVYPNFYSIWYFWVLVLLVLGCCSSCTYCLRRRYIVGYYHHAARARHFSVPETPRRRFVLWPPLSSGSVPSAGSRPPPTTPSSPLDTHLSLEAEDRLVQTRRGGAGTRHATRNSGPVVAMREDLPPVPVSLLDRLTLRPEMRGPQTHGSELPPPPPFSSSMGQSTLAGAQSTSLLPPPYELSILSAKKQDQEEQTITRATSEPPPPPYTILEQGGPKHM